MARFRKKQVFAKGLDTSYNPSSSNTIALTSGDMDVQYVSCDDTGTDESRAINRRLYLTGIGGYGECLRALTHVSDVAAGSGGVHGAHLSLEFGTSGTCTGSGIGVRAQLIPPAATVSTNVTYSALSAEIYCPASSDMTLASNTSFILISAAGDATAITKLEDGAFLFSIQGFTGSTGNMFMNGTTLGTTGVGTLRIKIGSTTGYIPVITAQAS